MSNDFKIHFTDDVDKIFKRLSKKDNVLYGRVMMKAIKIAENPYAGKPLRNAMKNKWRVQIGHFILVYRINEQEHEIRFLDFDHHDKVYKKK